MKREIVFVIFVCFVLLSIVVPSAESARNFTEKLNEKYKDDQSSQLKVKLQSFISWNAGVFMLNILQYIVC